MNRKTFIRTLNFICPIKSKTAKRWVAWSKDLAQMERKASETPCITYQTAGDFRKEILSLLSDIIQLYGIDIAEKVISLADLPACPFPWEMMGIARHFAKGGSVEEVAAKENSGEFEDYPRSHRTIRTAIKSDGIYSPQNYLCAVTDTCYSFLPDLPIRKQIEKILIHHRLPHVSFLLSESQDALRTGAPMVLVDCSDTLEDEQTGKWQHVNDLRWFRVPENYTKEN